ncbi:MAG: hypothetical protein IT430_20385 [Phycisphaerales bacterium]|nr:hypothetical protein [Phycisphaerales bacterium]
MSKPRHRRRNSGQPRRPRQDPQERLAQLQARRKEILAELARLDDVFDETDGQGSPKRV